MQACQGSDVGGNIAWLDRSTDKMSFEHTTAEVRGNAGTFRVSLYVGPTSVSFRFICARPYKVARCAACGLHYLYPRLIESAMQDLVSTSHPTTKAAHAVTLTRATLPRNKRCERLLNRSSAAILPKRGLTGGDLLEIGCGYGYLLDEARSWFRSPRRHQNFQHQGAEITSKNAGVEVGGGGIEQVPPKAQFRLHNRNASNRTRLRTLDIHSSIGQSHQARRSHRCRYARRASERHVEASYGPALAVFQGA